MNSSILSDIINAGILATSRTLVPSALSHSQIENKPIEAKGYTSSWNWRSLLQRINFLAIFQIPQHLYTELMGHIKH